MSAVFDQQAHIIRLTRLYAGLFLYLLAEQSVHTGQTAYSLNNGTPILAQRKSVKEMVSIFCHLHLCAHHLCTENLWCLTDVDATSLGRMDASSTSSQHCASAGPGLYSTRNVYVYSFRVLHYKNGIITCANRQDNEQYAHLTSFIRVFLFEAILLKSQRYQFRQLVW